MLKNTLHKQCVIGFIFCFSTLTALGQIDISGTYDVGTLTPLERPEMFGNNLFLAEEVASRMAQGLAKAMAADAKATDPDRAAPQKGAITQGYNLFWVDPGKGANQVDGKFRTSIITHPDNGRLPAMTDYGAQRRADFLANWQIIWRNPDPTEDKNSGTAWWLGLGDTGPYDHMEQRPLAERCIIGSRSTAGPPMLPNFYNNHKRIIQTPDHIMILTEMNHDARIIRMNAEHRPSRIKTWLGDSIGQWQGDTLVVNTRNFKTTPPLSGADENLHVIERFKATESGGLLYSFEVHNPTIWSEPWHGEYTWASSADKVYEYACHEGNYALGNIMRGARMLEKEAEAAAAE
jgi:hypothetical protein